MIFYNIVAFIFGFFFGSFFNVLIDRIPRGQDFVKSRSHCEKCKHELGGVDLIPVISYILLKGKCRYCKKTIPWMLPVVELITAVSFAMVTYFVLSTTGIFNPSDIVNAQWIVGAILILALALVTVSLLILIFFTDLKYQVIPDVYMIGLFVVYVLGFFVSFIFIVDLGVIYTTLYTGLANHFFAGVLMFLFFWMLHKFSKGKAMGDADMYLAGALGIYLGLKLAIVMWFVSFMVGAITGVALMVLKLKKLKSKIAFGPFLIIGFVIAATFGEYIAGRYVEFFLR